MRIGIIVAMSKEMAQLRQLLADAKEETRGGRTFIVGSMGEKEIVMQQCGIGKVNSAIGAAEMIAAYHPDLIVSSGCAGGADTSLEVGDVVVSSACTYHDVYCGAECRFGQVLGMPERYASDEALVAKAEALSCGVSVRKGVIASGDWFVDSREKMHSILGNVPDAVAVDMESCSIAQACHIYKVAFVSFRIISDVPLKDHKAAQYFDFWCRMAEGSFNVTRSFVEAI